MTPHSNFYLAINTGFPSIFDKSEQPRRQLAHDPRRLLIERLLCHDRRTNGRDLFATARLTPWRPANLARHRTNPHLAFWKMLKIRNDHLIPWVDNDGSLTSKLFGTLF
jgi:hypothetical protein